MRKISYILIMIMMLSVFVGCGAKQKMEEKVAEKIIEKAVGNNADIDVDGDKVSIKTEEGKVTFGSTKWPDSKIAGKVPEFKNGKIVSVMDSEDYMLVIIEEVKEKDFIDYYNNVKGTFKKDTYEAKSEDSISYTGQNDENIIIMISYTSDGTLSITGSIQE